MKPNIDGKVKTQKLPDSFQTKLHLQGKTKPPGIDLRKGYIPGFSKTSIFLSKLLGPATDIGTGLIDIINQEKDAKNSVYPERVRESNDKESRKFFEIFNPKDLVDTNWLKYGGTMKATNKSLIKRKMGDGGSIKQDATKVNYVKGKASTDIPYQELSQAISAIKNVFKRSVGIRTVIPNTSIDITNSNLALYNSKDNVKPNFAKSVLFNEFVERNDNTSRLKKDFVNTQDSLLGDHNIPLSKIKSFYGIEDGKFKVGSLDAFKDSTRIIPVRSKDITIDSISYTPSKANTEIQPDYRKNRKLIDRLKKEHPETLSINPIYTKANWFEKLSIPEKYASQDSVKKYYPNEYIPFNPGFKTPTNVFEYFNKGNRLSDSDIRTINKTIRNGKFLLNSPSTSNTSFFSANSDSIINQQVSTFLKNNGDAKPILVDNGRYRNYLNDNKPISSPIEKYNNSDFYRNNQNIFYQQNTDSTRFPSDWYNTNNMKPKMRLGGYDKGRMQGTEWGQAGVSAATGTLSGAAAGTAILPGIGTVVGGAIGLVGGAISGIFGGKAAATARAQANNMANEKVLTAINGKRDNDSNTLGLSKSFNPTTEFYAALGGRVPRTQYAKGGLVPISSTVDAVFGPTHNQSDGQGGTGVSISPNTEVEGGGNGKRGEVLIHTAKDTKVISNSLRVPGTNFTYADLANDLGKQQGQYEHKLINTEDMLDTTMKLLDKTRYNPTRGTIQRNAQKLAFRSKQLADMVDLKYNQVSGVFEEQEAMKDRMGISNIGKTQFGFGGDAGKLQMGVNVGSTMLQGIGNAFTLMQMNKIKTPKQSLLESAKFNTNFDISNQLDEINSTAGQSMKYIGDNTSNSNIARQQMSSILLNKGRSKNALFAQQANAQNTIFNQNIESDAKTKAANNEISYNNESIAFNRSMDTYSKISQGIAQFTQGAQDTASQYAQYQNTTDQMRMYAAMAPKGVNRDLIGKRMWERMYGKGSWDKSSTNLGIRAEQDVSEFTGKYGGRVPLARKGRLKVA